MKFSLKNYGVEVDPAYAVNGEADSPTTKLLRAEICLNYSLILKNINDGIDLPLGDRVIIARRVAMKCKLSPSTLTPRRQPVLLELIGKLNSELVLFWESAAQRKSTSGVKKTKSELIAENKKLKLELDRVSNLQLSSALSAAIENMLTEEVRLQASKIRKLNVEITQLRKVVENQAELNQKYIHPAN